MHSDPDGIGLTGDGKEGDTNGNDSNNDERDTDENPERDINNSIGDN